MTLPSTMAAVLLTGHGGFDKLEYREDVPLPIPDENEVLIRVAAAGVNNTNINTRIAWYSKQVTGQTNDLANTGSGSGTGSSLDEDGSWTGAPLVFPRIQGADICGHIVAVGDRVSQSRIRSMQRIESGRCSPKPIPSTKSRTPRRISLPRNIQANWFSSRRNRAENQAGNRRTGPGIRSAPAPAPGAVLSSRLSRR